jgi:hypothetical protein
VEEIAATKKKCETLLDLVQSQEEALNVQSLMLKEKELG